MGALAGRRRSMIRLWINGLIEELVIHELLVDLDRRDLLRPRESESVPRVSELRTAQVLPRT